MDDNFFRKLFGTQCPETCNREKCDEQCLSNKNHKGKHTCFKGHQW